MDPRRYLAVLSITAVVAFAIVWVWVAAMPLAFLDPEYPAWRAKLDLLHRCDLGTVLIVGDSRAAVDIIPALLPIRASNLAVGGGETIEAYVTLSRALACKAPPRRVVISLDAAHFTHPDLFWERSVRFGLVGLADLADLRRVETQTGDSSFAAPQRTDGMPSRFRAWAYAWRFPAVYFNSLLRGGVLLRWWENRAAYAAALASRGQYFFGQDAGSSAVAAEGHLRAFQPLPVLDRYFDRTLALLAQRGIPADFIAMPMNRSTHAAVRPSVEAEFVRYLAGYAARYPNFHLVGAAMPDWPNRYFGDAFSHLNRTGAQRLSTALGECLLRRMAAGRAGACTLANAWMATAENRRIRADILAGEQD
ncbi:MAG TPA: hypothetical protein VFN42_12090 [Acetobacteraceae bacterium]|nr:hypothetical protein [Acetobacteraceae bacterium]